MIFLFFGIELVQHPNINMDSVKSLFSEQKENAGFNIYTKIAIGFFILALLGINLFGYASVLTETISDTIGKPFRHLGSYLGFYTGETIKKTAEAFNKIAKKTLFIYLFYLPWN